MLHMARDQSVSIGSVGKCLQFMTSDSCSVSALFTLLPACMPIVLTILVSSWCADRSFSALPRIKTCLRTTMTSQRLNAAAVDRNISDSLVLKDVADDLNNCLTVRQNTFDLNWTCWVSQCCTTQSCSCCSCCSVGRTYNINMRSWMLMLMILCTSVIWVHRN